MTGVISVVPVSGLGEIRHGTDIGALLAASGILRDGDVVVVTQKIVSKAEGRVVPLGADDGEAKQRLVEAESRRVLRRRDDLRIVETHHGFVCANAGIDESNVPAGHVALLPLDPDRSARGLCASIHHHAGIAVAVVISDTFGRPWRRGVVDVAIGSAGLRPILDLRGTGDAGGRRLDVTEIAVVDEVAAAAELVMGKSAGVPVAVVRGVPRSWFGGGSVADSVVRSPEEDLFR